MTVYYEVFHQINPKGAVIIAFKEEKTQIRVKDTACNYGYFQWKDYPELKVRKTKQPTSMKNFLEVES